MSTPQQELPAPNVPPMKAPLSQRDIRRREAWRRYRESHREQIRERNRRYYAEHREAECARKRAWHARDPKHALEIRFWSWARRARLLARLDRAHAEVVTAFNALCHIRNAGLSRATIRAAERDLKAAHLVAEAAAAEHKRRWDRSALRHPMDPRNKRPQAGGAE